MLSQLESYKTSTEIIHILSTLLYYSTTVAICSCLAYVALALRSLYQSYTGPLGNVSGPWLARLTRLWLLRATASRKFEKINMQLHRKYGPIVRVAPNEYSIDDPDAANIIYRARDQLAKVSEGHLVSSQWKIQGKH